jgi:hypothetical protein
MALDQEPAHGPTMPFSAGLLDCCCGLLLSEHFLKTTAKENIPHADRACFCRGSGRPDCRARVRPLPYGRGLRVKVLRFSVGFGKPAALAKQEVLNGIRAGCAALGGLCAHAG